MQHQHHEPYRNYYNQHSKTHTTNQQQHQHLISLPVLIREPTAFESISSTLQSFSLSSLSSTFRQSSHQTTTSTTTTSSSKTSTSSPSTSPSSNLKSQLTTSHHPSSFDHDHTIYSNWSSPSTLLILNKLGLKIWDTQDLEGLRLLSHLTFDQIHRTSSKSQLPSQLIPSESSSHQSQSHNHTLDPSFEPISAAIIPSDESHNLHVALLFISHSQRMSRFEIISIDTATVLSSIDIPGIGVEIKLNRNLIIISTKAPLALHLFTLHPSDDHQPQSFPTITELPYSPILDLTPKPKTGEPVFSLGSNRLLAYASNRAPHEREPPIATGQGFSFSTHHHHHHHHHHHSEPRSPSKTADSFGSMGSSFGTSDLSNGGSLHARHINNHNLNHKKTASSSSNATSWKHSVTHNLDTIDETARRVGGGLLSGAKLLTSWGQHVWMNGSSSATPNVGGRPIVKPNHSNRRDHHHQINHYSKSAPLPYTIKSNQIDQHSDSPNAYNPEELGHGFSPHSTDPSIHSSSLTSRVDHDGPPLSPYYADVHGSHSTLYVESSMSSGNVRIIDLSIPSSSSNSKSYQPISHFRVSNEPIIYLSFNPSSSFILTSSIDAHSFHIFEIRPFVRIGKSCLRASDPSQEPTVWHRYKLSRGFTSAGVRDVIWSWDSKIVTVVTDRGTHHLFAIHPAGGYHHPVNENPQFPNLVKPDLPSILTLATSNPIVFQPLSVTISTFTTIKPKHLFKSHPSHHQTHTNFSSQIQAPTSSSHTDQSEFGLDSLGSSKTLLHHQHPHTSFTFLKPSFADRTHPAQPGISHSNGTSNGQRLEEFEKVLNPSHKSLPSGLLYDHRTQSVILYNLEIKKNVGVASNLSHKVSSVTRTVSLPVQSSHSHQVETHHHQRKKPTAPSGLSQLMQQQGQNRSILNRNVGQTSDGNNGSSHLTFNATVTWSLHPTTMTHSPHPQTHLHLTPMTNHDESDLLHRGSSSHAAQRWTSLIELDTFSHSIHILPKSIYTSHQFDFYHFSSSSSPKTQDLTTRLKSGEFGSLKLIKFKVRQEVLIEPGTESEEEDARFLNDGNGGNNGSGGGGIYIEPIRSAVETILDSNQTNLNKIVPGFPNGRSGRLSIGSGRKGREFLGRLSSEDGRRKIGRRMMKNLYGRTTSHHETGGTVSFDGDEVIEVEDLEDEEESFRFGGSDGDDVGGGWDGWEIDELDEMVRPPTSLGKTQEGKGGVIESEDSNEGLSTNTNGSSGSERSNVGRG